MSFLSLTESTFLEENESGRFLLINIDKIILITPNLNGTKIQCEDEIEYDVVESFGDVEEMLGVPKPGERGSFGFNDGEQK